MVQPHLRSVTAGIKRGLGSHVHHLSSPMLVLPGPSNPSRGVSCMLLSVAVFGYLEGSDISFRPCQDLSSPPVTPARWPVRVSCLSPCLMWWSFCSLGLFHMEAGPPCCCAPDFPGAWLLLVISLTRKDSLLVFRGSPSHAASCGGGGSVFQGLLATGTSIYFVLPLFPGALW